MNSLLLLHLLLALGSAANLQVIEGTDALAEV